MEASLLLAKAVHYYDSNGIEYCRATMDLDMSAVREPFTRELKRGAHILDAGCGSGRDSKEFLQQGFTVTLVDSSPEIARFASANTGQTSRVLRLQELDYEEDFDGVWACASLLHVAKSEMKDVMQRLVRALKPGGILYFSFIEGNTERYSAGGRFFNDYSYCRNLRSTGCFCRMPGA